MANEMSLVTQKQKMLEMRQTLNDFCRLMNSRMDGLNDKLNEYVMQGFPTEIAATYYQRYYMYESQAVNSLIQTINTAHYSYIDNVVSDIQAGIDRQ